MAKVMRLDVRAYAGDDDDGSSAADDAAAPPALGCLRNALVGEDIDMVHGASSSCTGTGIR